MGYEEKTRTLIDAGADVNAKNSHGKTALGIANERSYVQTRGVIPILLEATVSKPSVALSALMKTDVKTGKMIIKALAKKHLNQNRIFPHIQFLALLAIFTLVFVFCVKS